MNHRESFSETYTDNSVMKHPSSIVTFWTVVFVFGDHFCKMTFAETDLNRQVNSQNAPGNNMATVPRSNISPPEFFFYDGNATEYNSSGLPIEEELNKFIDTFRPAFNHTVY